MNKNKNINTILAIVGIFASSALILSQYYSIKASKMNIKLTEEKIKNEGIEIS